MGTGQRGLVCSLRQGKCEAVLGQTVLPTGLLRPFPSALRHTGLSSLQLPRGKLSQYKEMLTVRAGAEA